MKTTVLPVFGIILVGSIVALGFNSVRTDVRIKLSRNYFKIAERASSESEQGSTEDGSDSRLKHPYAVVTLDDMIDMVDSEAHYNGDIVLLDARNEEDYSENHIPRAFHVDNYNVDKCLDDVQPYLDSAEIIVVYCGGGECEDSIFLATELEARGVSFDKLRLFEGGLKSWQDADLPLEETADETGFTRWSQADFDVQDHSTP